MNNFINKFSKEIDYIYKNEKYSIRDNGAIFRHYRIGKRKRKLDNQWTFGWTNKQTGYLELAGSSIHRLVAYAFHGNPLTDDYVVHHIDGDRQNNKLENLKWISRLESILMDQIVLSIVIHFCGSIEVFKENSLKLFADLVLYNFEHFSISKEEAMLKLGHLKNWAFTNSEKAKAILKKYENILGT